MAQDDSDLDASERPEAWHALMAGLWVDFDLLVARRAAAGTPLSDPRTTQLLAITNEPASPLYGKYAVANEVQRRLAGHEDAAQLSAMAATQLVRATEIGATGHEALAPKIKEAEAAGKTDDLRALVLALLDLIHRRFVDRRSERRARSDVAMRLCYWGFGLLGGALVLLFAGFIYSSWSGWFGSQTAATCPTGCVPEVKATITMFEVMGKWHLTALIYFGFFGAFFSRLIAFQKGIGTLTWDDLDKGYRNRVLIVRLMIGGFAALIFYYFIAGKVVGGEIFPGFADGAKDFGLFWQTGKVTEKGSQTYTFPSDAFAKLVIWSFLAGFAERFLPDQLSALESKANTAK